MNTCEHVTDLLPELAAGTLSAAEAADLHEHIRTCEDCASEWLLIAALRDAPMPAPELAARITAVVASRPVVRQNWGARQLTIAATIVMAMIGGGIVIQQYAPQPSQNVVSAPDTDTSASASTATSGTTTGAGAYVSDPAVGNGSLLPQMTERQLEALLAEMGS